MSGRLHHLERAAWVAVALLAAGIAGCAEDSAVVESEGGEVVKSSAAVRAERRLYDGAPPIIPHDDFGMTCTQCHNKKGVEVPDVGFAPPQPHTDTPGMSNVSRCTQCHVFKESETIFAASEFVGLRQDLRRGGRLNPIAPPTIPHKVFMRENCAACHTGTAAREEIRTTRPERIRCRQCHVPAGSREEFDTLLGEGLAAVVSEEEGEQ
jgi:cytochrome c-type protein NapB